MSRSGPKPNRRPPLGGTARRGAAAAAVPERLEDRRLFAAFDVLIFSRTEAFRHDSIDEGIAAIEDLGEAHDFTVAATEHPSDINDDNLAQYEAVVFLSTTGDFLNDTQQAAFERYIEAGGGFVGIHGAAADEENWDWYGGLLGARYNGNAGVTPGTIRVENTTHRSTAGLPDPWTRTEEWYNFATNPRDAGVNVLLTLDEDTITGGTMGDDHPLAWYHEYDGGRSFYTALGHTAEAWAEPPLLRHVLGGIEYAAGLDTAAPAAAASADQTSGTAPLAVAFSAANTTPGGRGPVTYAWDFTSDNAPDSTAQNPTFTYAQAGNYTARLIVTDAIGRTSEDTVSVTVTAPEPPPPDPTPPTAQGDTATTTEDTPVTINVLANDTDDTALDPASVTIATQPAHGTASVNAATGVVTYVPAATYPGPDTFTYTVRDAAGAASAAATVTLTVTELPPPPPPDEGAGLSVTLSGKVPSAAVGGGRERIRQTVTVRNLTTSPFNDQVTVSLYASTNETIDAADPPPLASVTRTLRLKPGASRPVPLGFTGFPAAVADGSYRLLARASSPTGGTSNTAASATAVTIAAPFRDLTAAFAATPAGTVRAGGRGSARLLLRNAGNATAAGTVTVTLTATGATGDVPLGPATTARVNLRPSATKFVTSRFQIPTAAGDYTLRATVAASDEIGETDEGNNTATAVGPFTVV